MVNFQIENLSFSYPGSEKKALNNICLTVKQGEFIVLCGKSGSGKSTLLRLLKPELSPHGERSGTIRFFGEVELPQRQSAQRIGFLLQNTEYQAVTHSVRTELAFGLENLGLDSETIRLRMGEIAAYFSLEGIIDQKISALSGGQKQLVCLASVLMMHPDVLIFDEPTAQLDPMAAETLLATVQKLCRENGITVILSEHRLQSVLPMADRVIVMQEGEIVCDAPPRDIPSELVQEDAFVSLAVPVPMRLHAKLHLASPVPLNVAEGRQMLRTLFPTEPQVTEPPQTTAHKSTAFAVEAKDLWYAYGKSQFVLKGLNLKIREGSFFALLGANGVGKTTALSLMSGLLENRQGTVKLFGKPIRKIPDSDLFGKTVGVLPQKCESLFGANTVREDLEKVLPKDKEKLESVAAFCEIAHLLERHPYDLSGGELQRAALAMVLLKEPRILFLDEPTKGMDNLFKKQFAEKIRALNSGGTTVVIVSHDTEFCAEYCDECALLFDGVCALQADAHRFFAQNFFYTTVANKIARDVFPLAVTERQVLTLCETNLKG